MRLITLHCIFWTFLVVLAMAVGATSALVFAGVVDWFGPTTAAFNVLATFVLVVTVFSMTVKDKESL